MAMNDARKMKTFIDENCIYPDFPQKGIQFIDIFPLLAQCFPADFQTAFPPTDKIVFTPEARGFLFYQALSPQWVIPLRKAGKLPGELMEIRYEKEYGSDSLFFQLDALRRAVHRSMEKGKEATEVEVMIFDDVSATGGTVQAVADCLENLRIEGLPRLKVTESRFYLEIESLGGRKRLEDRGLSVQSVHLY